MSKVVINKGLVHLTEQTVREIVSIIDKVKSETTFTFEPMPNYYCGDRETFFKGEMERGRIYIESEYAGIGFFVYLEKEPRTQESLGYKLKKK